MDKTRFHQLDLGSFNARIPDALPTAANRTKFAQPEIGDSDMAKWAICIELTRTIESVLDAAESSHGLEVLRTPYPKAKGNPGKLGGSINHIGIYPVTEVARLATKMTKENTANGKVIEDGQKQDSLGRCSWPWLSVLGEVKSLNSELCAFYMDPDSPQQTTGSTFDDSPGEQGLYQLTAHMSNLFAYQHRLFVYGFYVQWKWARLLYFDRSGALISEPFDWTETTSPLHNFVWKVAHMSPEQLGYDPTAQLASELDVNMLRSKMQDQSLPAEVRQYVWNTFLSKATASGREPSANATEQAKPQPELLSNDFPIFKLTVTSSDPSPGEVFPGTSLPSPSKTFYSERGAGAAGGERTFLVGRPHFLSDALVGRCTRGYIAFDLQNNAFCFLKDSWRPLTLTSTRSLPEHLVYERLHRHNVAHIASPVCGGDVGGHLAQVTHAQDDMSPQKKHSPHVHYRIVVKEIGVPLTEFKSFTELARVFRHALLAHKGAWEQAGILHHDINLGNILIDPSNRFGILIDWDLSRLASSLEDGPVEPNHAGTWQFQSALVLRYPRKPYRLADDIESFIHAFRYLVLRYHRTDICGIRCLVETYFEHGVRIRGVRVGGETKMSYFRSELPPFGVVGHPELQALLDAIARRCYHEFHKLVDCDLMARKYGIDIFQLSEQQSVTNAPENIAQLESKEMAEAAPTPRRASRKVRPMLEKFKHLDTVQPPSPPREVVVTVDACDIKEGFLSHHSHLIEFFALFCSAEEEEEEEEEWLDKHEDQFVARAAEEPVRVSYYEPIWGSSDDSDTSASLCENGARDF